ncbi:hypothetical protein E4U21_007074 [Claviceps maximensis]|nr:hypothetical protein E4U21_007074 [Claviceps maximensis]
MPTPQAVDDSTIDARQVAYPKDATTQMPPLGGIGLARDALFEAANAGNSLAAIRVRENDQVPNGRPSSSSQYAAAASRLKRLRGVES